MRLFVSRTHAAHHVNDISFFARIFPTPSILAPVVPGVDISDSSIKWLSLEPLHNRWKVAEYGSYKLASGIVSKGRIENPAALSRALADIKSKVHNMAFAHAALPEETGYVFSMHVPRDATRAQTLNMIEFELTNRVPESPDSMVYDYDVSADIPDSLEREIAVVAFPKEISEQYASVFENAGIELFSLEIEPRSISRATSSHHSLATEVLVDFGGTRSCLAVLHNGIPVFTSTVEVGGETITRILVDKLGLSPEGADKFKDESGIFSSGQKVPEAMTGIVATLSDEIGRLVRYWNSRKLGAGEHIEPVSRVILSGGSSNLKGLPEYISGVVQLPCERANVWQNVCSFDDYIPPIEQREAFTYTTAIGLALRSAI